MFARGMSAFQFMLTCAILSVTSYIEGRVNSKFGPEISLGRRIRETTGRRVMVVKYCKGGTNVRRQWNPTTAANTWNYDLDDGTAAFLKPNTIFKGPDVKEALFVNQVYVVRKVTEALDAAGVAYEWKAFAWLQGAADKSSTWEEFGEDTARLFDAVRKRTVGQWDLPIVDTGAGGNPSGPTGKQYATQLVKGCNVRNVEMPIAVPDPEQTAAGCISGPGTVCPSFYIPTLLNHFGWDTRMNENNTDPNAAEFKTTNKTFAWWAEYPTDQHSAYEGMIVKGRMLANEYIRAFTEYELTDVMKADDPTLLIDLPKCAEGTLPTQEAVCWTDERTGEQREAECIPESDENQCLASIQAACSEAATSQKKCLACLQANKDDLLALGAACEGQEATPARGHAVCRLLVAGNSNSKSRPKRASQPQAVENGQQQQQQPRRFIRGRLV